MKSIDGF